jgi:hypothetical protein
MSRSLIATPGGFSHVTALPFDIDGAACAFCRSMMRIAWVQVASSRSLCARCLPDPWADDGEAGRSAAAELESLHEESRTLTRRLGEVLGV